MAGHGRNPGERRGGRQKGAGERRGKIEIESRKNIHRRLFAQSGSKLNVSTRNFAASQGHMGRFLMCAQVAP